jgi:MYXO-CTERM domain-containing protein
MPLSSRLAFVSLLALGLGAPSLARADVVEPEPLFCPPGTFGHTSHGGPSCMKMPPENCPPGWRGVDGGTCQLIPCATTDDCAPGEACTEHLACIQHFFDDSYEPGEEQRERRGAAHLPPSLLAEPRMPRTPRPTPIVRYEAVNLCSAEVPCAAPRLCSPEKICAPRGARALAYRGDDITPARLARKTASLPSGEPARSRPLERTAPRWGGCAGCTAADASSGGSFAALLVALVLFWRRTRRAG